MKNLTRSSMPIRRRWTPRSRMICTMKLYGSCPSPRCARPCAKLHQLARAVLLELRADVRQLAFCRNHETERPFALAPAHVREVEGARRALHEDGVDLLPLGDQPLRLGDARPPLIVGDWNDAGGHRLERLDGRRAAAARLWLRGHVLARAAAGANGGRAGAERGDVNEIPSIDRHDPQFEKRTSGFEVFSLREYHREHRIRREHATGVVTALGDDLNRVLRAQLLDDVFRERLAAGATSWPLGHGVR